MSNREARRFPEARGTLHHFAGRHAEMERLRTKLHRIAGGVPGASEEGIALVTGVPGVGKTELSRRFLASAEAVGAGGRMAFGGLLGTRAPKTLTLSTSVLANPQGTFLEVADAIGESKIGRSIAEVDATTSIRSVGAAGVKVGVDRDRQRTQPDFSTMLKALRKAWPKKCPALVIRIDELQNAAPSSGVVLRELHEGTHGCPIMTLGVGLQHTRSVLAELGISRVADPIEIYSLNAEDTKEAIRENLTYYGVGDVAPRSLAALESASCGFPAHIHGYLEAAVDATVRFGQGALDDDATLQRVIARGHAARAAYYEARLDSMMLDDHRDPRTALFPVVAELAAAAGAPAFLPREDAVHRCHRGPYNGSQVIQQAVAHGVLTSRRGAVGFGIPSFRNHMVTLWREREGHQSGAR